MSTATKAPGGNNIGWLVSLAVSLFFLLGYPGLSAAASEAVVGASSLNVRSGPGPQHDVSDQVAKGTRLPVLDQQGDWYNVRLNTGKTGWVAGWLVTIEKSSTTNSAAKQVVVKTETLNVREGPGAGNAKVGEVHNGDRLQVLSSSGDWYEVRMSNDDTGWVAGWLVDIEGVAAPSIDEPSQESDGTGKEAVVSSTTLNVRGGPGTSNDIAARVNKGDRLPIIESSNGWCKVKLPGEKTGWVAGWLVDIKGTAAPSTDKPAQESNRTGKEAVVTSTTLNVRGGPGTSNDVVARVNQGDRLPIIESSNGWCKVELPGGGTGWVAGWLVDVKAITQPQETPVTGEAVVYASDANVRGGPGTGHNVVTQVSRGERMDVMGKAGEWYKVQSSRGVVGWISGSLLHIDSASASTPEKDEEQPGKDNNDEEITPEEKDSDAVVETGDSEENSTGQRLTKIHLREDNDRIIVDIAATAPMEHNIFTLTNPDRLVVDLIGIKPGDIPGKVDVNSKLVSSLRTGWFNKSPDTVRMVFDVSEAVMFSAEPDNDSKDLKLEIYVPKPGDYLRNRVIAIDPGHGGREPGVIGSSGLQEKNVNLDVALLTAHLLEQNGARVILTRSSDTFVDLEDRTDIARKAGADIFVSIHMNANPIPSKSGTSIYYRRDDISGLGVSQEDNKILAKNIQSQLLKELGRNNLGVKQANFVVLRTAVMPAVLAEVSFLSNAEEERLLRKDTYRAKAAEAITKGINNYFAQRAG